MPEYKKDPKIYLDQPKIAVISHILLQFANSALTKFPKQVIQAIVTLVTFEEENPEFLNKNYVYNDDIYPN